MVLTKLAYDLRKDKIELLYHSVYIEINFKDIKYESNSTRKTKYGKTIFVTFGEGRIS